MKPKFRSSGGVRFLHSVYTPWIEHDGEVTGWVASVSDITERVWARKILQGREQRLRLALDASGGGSWTFDARTGRVDWDDRFRELYGFTPDEPASVDAWPSRVHEEDRPRVLAVLDEVLRTKRNSWDNTFRIVRPDGTMAWIEARGRAERDANRQITRLIGIGIDITKNKQAEEALRESEQMLRFALDASGAGCWMRDSRTGRVVWDDRFRKLYGFTADQPASFEAWLSRVHEEDRAQLFELIDKFKNSETQVTFDATFRIVRPDGTVAWMQSLGQVRRDPAGRIMEFTGLELDVTDRHDAEEALRMRRVAEVEHALQKQAEDALRRSHAELEQRTVQLRRLASQLTLTEQNAREHLARTLHDGLQQLLFSAGITLDQAVKTNRQDDHMELLGRAHADIKEAMDAARTLSLISSLPC